MPIATRFWKDISLTFQVDKNTPHWLISIKNGQLYSKTQQGHWANIFSFVIWNLWKNRNYNNINNLEQTLYVNLVLNQSWEYNFVTERNSLQQSKIRIAIHWLKLPQDTIKLNIDRAFSNTNLHAGRRCFS